MEVYTQKKVDWIYDTTFLLITLWLQILFLHVYMKIVDFQALNWAAIGTICSYWGLDGLVYSGSISSSLQKCGGLVIWFKSQYSGITSEYNEVSAIFLD